MSTIKLSLSNFRSHKSLDLEFPKTGLIKLDGPSGRGKSNILKALIWALWGGSTNVVNYQAKTCSVSLDGLIAGLNIRRDKPNKLAVNGTSDGDMQAIIAEQLAMTEFEFEVSSYMPQDQRNSLVFRSPAEQLEIFNKLALNGLDPEAIKARAELLLDNTETELGLLQYNIDLIKQKRLQCTTLIGVYMSEVKDAGIYTADRPPTGLLKDLANTIARLREDIGQCTKLVNHPARTGLAKAQQAKDYANAKILENQEVLAHLVFRHVEELEEAGYIKTACVSEMAELEKQLKTQRNMLASLNDAEKLQAGLDKNHNHFQCLALEYLSQKTVENLPKMEKLCGSLYRDWQAVKGVDKQDFKQGVEESIGEVLANLAQVKAKFDRAESVLFVHKSCVKKKEDLLQDIYKNDLVIADALKVMALNDSLETVDILQTKISSINTELMLALESQEKAQAQMRDYEDWLKVCEANHRFRASAEAEERKLVELDEEFTALEGQQRDKSGQVSDIKKFLNILQKANLGALEQLIQDLNEKIEKYIQALFDCDISVQFATQKEQINKKKIDKIQLLIKENELAIQKLSDLSGGQISRIALSVQLALSELFRSPVLILDEATKGLDLENIERVMLVLKNVAENKLVITVDHSVANGSVEQVFTI